MFPARELSFCFLFFPYNFSQLSFFSYFLYSLFSPFSYQGLFVWFFLAILHWVNLVPFQFLSYIEVFLTIETKPVRKEVWVSTDFHFRKTTSHSSFYASLWITCFYGLVLGIKVHLPRDVKRQYWGFEMSHLGSSIPRLGALTYSASALPPSPLLQRLLIPPQPPFFNSFSFLRHFNF